MGCWPLVSDPAPPHGHVPTEDRGITGDGGGASPPPLDSDPQGVVNTGHQGIRGGHARQGEMPASYQPGQGGEGRRRAQGSPFLCGRELMLAAGCQGRKTNQRSIFKFSCGHYPRSQERRRGGGERRKQLGGRLLAEGGGGWRADRQRGRALIRTQRLRPGSQLGSPRPGPAPPLEPHPHRLPSLQQSSFLYLCLLLQ